MGAVEAATTPTAPDAPPEAAEAGSEAASGSGDSNRHAPAPDSGGNTEQPPEPDGERDEGGRYLSREAASYRRRLRDAEAERDSLRTRLEGYERQEVERLAAGAGLQVPADVWSFGASLDTLRGEDDGIDAEAVTGLVGEIVKDRPGLQARPQGDLGIGRGAGATSTRTEEPKVGLSALLKPEGR
jgi:hypothetical protein